MNITASFLLLLVIVGILIASVVLAIALIVLGSKGRTQPQDEVFHFGEASDNPYASSNVARQRGRRSPWLLAGLGILACIACLCPLSGIFAIYFLNDNDTRVAPRPVNPAPWPVEAPADGGRIEDLDSDSEDPSERE